MMSNDLLLQEDDLVVVKVGGGASLDYNALWDDLAALDRLGVRIILVHGGNAALTNLQERLGAPARFVQNARGDLSRYTDAEAMEIFNMVYAGQMNVRHVCGLRARGVDALGLTGVDGGLIVGERNPVLRCVEDGKKKVLRDDHTGTITRINGSLLSLLLDNGHVPVVTVPAYAAGPNDAAGVPINVDGDTAAERIAEAIGADALVFLSDVPGLLEDRTRPETLIATVHTPAEWTRAEAAAGGRMRRKVQAARRAVESGVGRVVIAHANAPTPVRAAFGGAGTHFQVAAIQEVVS